MQKQNVFLVEEETYSGLDYGFMSQTLNLRSIQVAHLRLLLLTRILSQWRCGYSSWMRSSRIIHRILTTVQLRCLWPRQISLFTHIVQAYTIETPRWSILYRGSWMNRFDLTWFTVLAHRVGIAGGCGWGLKPPPQFMSTDARFHFEWKSALNFNPLAKFQTFRHLSPSSFRLFPTLLYYVCRARYMVSLVRLSDSLLQSKTVEVMRIVQFSPRSSHVPLVFVW